MGREERLAELKAINEEKAQAEAEVNRWRSAKEGLAQKKVQAEQVETPQTQTPVENKEENKEENVEQSTSQSYKLSDEVDENGRQFVLNSNGGIEFGRIKEETGLPTAPILLSEGIITNHATNDGYGLVHIEARHGEQIRNAGFNSVVEFIEEVAKNYDVIREGNKRNGNQTYMLQLTDKHNNTLMVELSGDGDYWNINTAGIFKTSYGKNRKEVYNRHTTDKQSTEIVEESQNDEQSGTQSNSSMNSPTLLKDKTTNNIPNEQAPKQKIQSPTLSKKRKLAENAQKDLGITAELIEDPNEIPSVEEDALMAIADGLRVKGWHNPETGKTYLYVPNVDSFTDAKKTLLHEKVAHEGLPKLLGKDKFNKLCDDVWNVMNKERKKRFLAYACNKKEDELTVDDYLNKHKTRQAADEFMASIAEGGIQTPTLWEKIKQLVRNALRSVGINVQLNDADIAYLLYRSRNNLQKGEMTSTDSKRAEIEKKFKEGETKGAMFLISNTPEEFDAIKKEAVEKRGIVMPNLNNAIVNVVDVPKHDFTGTGKDAINKAEKWANENIAKEHTYHEGLEDEFKYTIDDDAISKFLSKSSTSGSDNLGVHLAVLKELPKVIDNSIEVEIHPDYQKKDKVRSAENGVGRDDMLVHRMYGAVNIDGKTYKAKTTIHEFRDKENKAYDYKITEVELIISGSSTSNALNNSTSITAAKILENVEKSYDKGKKLLDESKKTSYSSQKSENDIRFSFRGNSGYTERENGSAISVRAEYAEENGTFTAGTFRTRYGVSKTAFEVLEKLGIIKNTEWHHTGKSFKRSDFFSWGDSDRAIDHGRNYFDAQVEEGSFGNIYQSNKKEIDRLAKEAANAQWEYKTEEHTIYVPSIESYIADTLNRTWEDLLTDEEKQTRLNRHSSISEGGYNIGSAYERKLMHESVDDKYKTIARNRLDEGALRKAYDNDYSGIIMDNAEKVKRNATLKERNLSTNGKEAYLRDILGMFEKDTDKVNKKVDFVSSYERSKIEYEARENQRRALIAENEKLIDSVEERRQKWVSKKLQEGAIERKERIGKRPEFFITEREEMHGKYGWFEASWRYNLPIYYSGIDLKNQRNLNQYKKYDQEIVELNEKLNETLNDGTRFRTSGEIDKQYPNWLEGTTNESGKHSTQVEGTRKTYNKVGTWIEENLGKDVSILDASSGMGYGTADLRERGFNIEDVEPYQSDERKANNPATYSSYGDINKQYDFIISNAVLNVIPDDWRRNVLHDMAARLKNGGKMFINTRKAGEEKNIKDKIELDSPQEVLVKRNGKIASYQRFFTPTELKEWVESELGDGYSVEIANKNNSGTSGLAAVVVTKKEGTMFRVTPEEDQAYLDAVERGDMATAQKMVLEAAKLAMPNTKVVDEDGNPLVVYHGDEDASFTIFDREKIEHGNGFWFTTIEGEAQGYAGYNEPRAFFINAKKIVSDSNVKEVLKDYHLNGGEGASEYAFAIDDLAYEFLRSRGYDAVTWSRTGESDLSDAIIIAFDPNQIKSADPVTYDDNGNVIPLSERFNEEKEDIRFRKGFIDGINANELIDKIDLLSSWTNGFLNLTTALEDYFKGEIVSASNGAKHAIERGLVPVPAHKYAGLNEEYHHIEFRGEDGETFVEAVPFIKAEDVEKDFDIRFRKVFHGSGAKFDKFDHSFMGTGEGAQAFGWGTYVTEVEGIGRTYATTMRDKLISEKHKENAIINKLAKQTLESSNGNKEEALDYLRGLLNESWSDKKRVKAQIKIIETGKFLPETKLKANLYTVEIPDDNGSNYLHWKADNNQETIGKLNEAYRNMLLERGVPAEDISPYFEPFNKGLSGESIYKIFARELGGDKEASQFLNREGFVGISYPAEATTGGRADGARNYVIFNENDAVIEDIVRFRITPEEAKRRADEINNIKATKVESDNYTKEELKEIYRNLDSVNKDGVDIEFYHGVFGKAWHGEESLFAKVVPYLNKILANAKIAYSEKDLMGGTKRKDGTTHKSHPNIINYHNYVGKANIDGNECYVRFTVQEEVSGKQGTHSFFVSDISLYNNSLNDVTTDTKNHLGKTPIKGIIDTKLQQFFEYAKQGEEKSKESRFRIANENQEIFVSNAQRAVEGIKQEKGTPQQWLAMIEKNGGLKAGEDKWLGLSDWLKASDAKTITKQEILDFIGENKIQIEEVEYSNLEDSERFKELSKEYRDLYYEFGRNGDAAFAEMVERYGDDFELGFAYSGDELVIEEPYGVDAAESFLDAKTINSTRLGYTTDGLDNKREIALVVPNIESWNANDNIHFGDAGDGRAVAWVRFGETTVPVTKVKEVKAFNEPRKSEMTGHDVYAPIGTKNSKDYVVYGKMRTGEMAYVVFIGENPVSKHNTLEEARLAMNEYYKEHKHYIPAGQEKVLVIDEVQSKRHQEGREKGYVDANIKKRFAEVQKQRTDFRKQHPEITTKVNDALYGRISAEEYKEWATSPKVFDLLMQGEALDREYNNLRDALEGVPYAPFEKNWAELAMKRMLRYAAENGFDKVAWTTGTQQAERYDIGKVVDEIQVSDNYNGEHEVRGYKNGELTLSKNTENGEQGLAELVGKEIARKAYSNLHEGKTDYTNERGVVSIKGNDLMVGGEGMKGFYDKILPSFVSKYTKKWGAKVGEVTMPNLEENNTMHSVDITPEMKESVMEGQTMFRFIGEKGASNLDKAEEATTRLDNLKVAREMEEANKDAKSIKMATGWERGADGKWRYETEDLKVRDWDWVISRKKITLEDIIEDEELFNAYPSLRDVNVKKIRGNRKLGSFNDETNTISINVKDLKYLFEGMYYYGEWLDIIKEEKENILSVLMHEVQHAIQNIEGFARGGTQSEFVYEALSNKDRQTYNKLADNVEEKYKETSRYEDNDKEFKNALKRWLYAEDKLDAFESEHLLGIEGYKRLAGEVESRNVQERRNLSLEERRQSLADETEDVAREDQIFIYDAIESAMEGQVMFRLSSSNASAIKYDKVNGTNVKEFFDFLRGGKVFEKGKPNVFHIANAGDLLEQYGIKGKFMVGQFTFSRTHTQDEDHNLGIKEWVDVINNLNNPLAITSYKGLPNEYRIYTYATVNGKNICVGVNVSLKDEEIELSRIISAYGRDINNLLGKEGVNLLYPDIEELKRRISQGSTAPNSLLNATSTASTDKDTKNIPNTQEGATRFLIDEELSNLNSNFAKNETADEILERLSQTDHRTEVKENDRMVEELGQSERGRGSEKASRDAQETKRTLSGLEEARIVGEYAKENNLWIPIEDSFKLGTTLPSGNESDVYLSKDKQSVYKVNNLMNSKGKVSNLIKKVNLHNLLFPETSYAIVGITGFEGRSIYPILQQIFIPESQPATLDEIDNYMNSLGFTKEKDYVYSNGNYVVSDLRPRNVLKDSDGDIYVIDAEIEPIRQGNTRFSYTEGDEVTKGKDETLHDIIKRIAIERQYMKKEELAKEMDSLAKKEMGNIAKYGMFFQNTRGWTFLI